MTDSPREALPRVRPPRGRVLIERVVPEEKIGRIIVPEVAKNKQQDTGTIIAVGPGLLLSDGTVLKPEVRVGDKVVFNKYGGNAVELAGVELLVMREAELHAVIED